MKAVIVEDERLAAELLRKFLESATEVEVIAECRNGFDAVKIINRDKPDLVFLDIQMPKLNGFETLELLDYTPLVIFTTAFNQYAIKAFEVNAVDYLLKPFSEERLLEAVEKARQKLSGKTPLAVPSLPATTDGGYLERVVIKNGSSIFIESVNNIMYIEAQDDYVMIHTPGKKYMKQRTMKFYEENLDPKDFIRIHRSYICAVKEIKHIELLEKDSYQVRLSDKKSLPVSRSGYEKLKEIFK